MTFREARHYEDAGGDPVQEGRRGAVREAISELNQADDWLDLKIRTGVNTGEALVVLGAPASKGEGMTAGDVMNTAARLQSNRLGYVALRRMR